MNGEQPHGIPAKKPAHTTTTPYAEQRMAHRLESLKDAENILRRVGHSLLVASTRLGRLPMEDQSLYVAEIRETLLKSMEEALIWAEKLLKP